MSCPMGLSKSCNRPAGNQLAPSAINSSICCCKGVFVGIVITMIVLFPIGIDLAACSFIHFIGSKTVGAQFIAPTWCHTKTRLGVIYHAPTVAFLPGLLL